MPFDDVPFDFRAPNYLPIYKERMDRLYHIKAHPELIPDLKLYYRDHIAQFIDDWGMTFDPRNIDVGLPAYIPFKLFPRQFEAVDFIVDSWRRRDPGVMAKSRDMGLSWIAVAVACSMCNLYEGFVFGFGSRKREYVDKLDDPKSLFWKARKFQEALPVEFTGPWSAKRDSTLMKLTFPATGSYMTGESGDEIGRGDRTAIYVVDESASLERPMLAESSLQGTTNCRIDISSAKGMDNPFFTKWSRYPDHRKFRYHWRDDPRKDQEWYDKQCELFDPVTIAQEIDIDFAASVEGVIIPTAWVQASIDLHVFLELGDPTGEKSGALDVADEGRDKCAYAGGHGILLTHLEQWSGKGGDTFETTVKAFHISDGLGITMFKYDSDGIGAAVRGDARVINDTRGAQGLRKLEVNSFRGSGAVHRPEHEDWPGRKNEDYFLNRKAQEYFWLRRCFLMAYRARNGEDYDKEGIISIPSNIPHRAQLEQELSQPTYILTTSGKIQVDKAPDGSPSPNLADAVMMWKARASRRPMIISPEAVARSRR